MREMNEFVIKLNEVVQRNTIPGIGARVEVHHQKLNIIFGKLYRVKILIDQQEQALKKEDTFIDDKSISPDVEKEQRRIREDMRETEKEYVDIKYECYSFFADTITKQVS